VTPRASPVPDRVGKMNDQAAIGSLCVTHLA
jgi:hypothetical protein